MVFIAAAAGGWSVNAARKMALLLCSLCVLPVSATPLLPSVWPAVALVTLAVAAHCGYAANFCTLSRCASWTRLRIAGHSFSGRNSSPASSPDEAATLPYSVTQRWS